MSTGLRGTIKNHLGEISELSIKGYFNNKLQGTSSYDKVLDDIENCLSIDRLDDKTKMIIGKYWHPKYPISKTHFEETFKYLKLNNYPLKEKPRDFNLEDYILTSYVEGMTSENHRIKFLDLDQNSIVLKNINFGDYIDNSVIFVDREITFDNCNVWLCGKRIHFVGDGKFVLKGTTNLFGGVLISHLHNKSPIEIKNSTHQSIIKLYGLEIGILPKTDNRQSYISTSFIKIMENINRFNMCECNIFINCDESFEKFECNYDSNHTVALIHDGDIKERDITYSLTLDKIFIDGKYIRATTNPLKTYTRGYGISLIYSRGNINITNNTYQLHGVDSILNTSLTKGQECSHCDTVCKIENSSFNVTDVTKLFTTCIKNYILKNVRFDIGSTQDSSELIAKGYPDLFRFNKTNPIENLNIKMYDCSIKCYDNLDSIVCLRDDATTNDKSIKVYIDGINFYDSKNASESVTNKSRIGFKLNPFNESDAVTEYEIYEIPSSGDPKKLEIKICLFNISSNNNLIINFPFF